MIKILTFTVVSLFLMGCSLEEDIEDSADVSEVDGIWKSDEQDTQEEYLQFGDGEINVLYIVDSLSCSRVLRTYNIATMDSDIFTYSRSGKVIGVDGSYSRIQEEFPVRCDSNLTNDVEVKIGFKQLPEFLESYYPIPEERIRLKIRVAFDTDNNNAISVGDVVFELKLDLNGEQIPTWDTLATQVWVVYSASSDFFSWSYGESMAADLDLTVQDNHITLLAKASDHSGVGDISNDTQVEVLSIFETDTHTQKDRYPDGDDMSGFFIFTEGENTNYLGDAVDDVSIIESEVNTMPINLSPIFDIESIEVNISN